MKLRPALLLLSLIPAALQLSTAAAAAVEEEKTPVPASTKDSASTDAVPLRPADESSPDKQAAEPLDGAALLEDCIASPGGYNQMCMLPELLPSSVPMPFGAVLVSRHYFCRQKTSGGFKPAGV